MKTVIATIICSVLILTACRKDDKNEQTLPGDSIMAKVNSWLTAQQYPGTPQRNQKIQDLIPYLDYSRAYNEELSTGEKFTIVPVKPGFRTINNKNRSPLNLLVFTVDRSDKIRSGKIIQYLPESGSTPDNLPKNTIHNIFNSLPVEANGTYTVLTVWDHYMFELAYKNGQLTSSKAMEPEGGYARWQNARTSGCIDWFIVTTIYINGEYFDQTYEYVGTTCNGCVPQEPTLESLSCDGNGGNPGGPPVSEPEPVSKQVQWVVKADAVLGWHVDSWEFLQGAKPIPPLVPYFTAITHINDDIVNSLTPNQPGYSTWHKLTITTGVTGAQSTCQSIVTGKVTCPIRADVQVSNAKGWLAVTEFP